VAWAAKAAESRARLKVVAAAMVSRCGDGRLLCAITCAAYVKEARGDELKRGHDRETGKVCG
jgi:hypothetical protein